jgi:formate hydrogenlyase transcriptional activator
VSNVKALERSIELLEGKQGEPARCVTRATNTGTPLVVPLVSEMPNSVSRIGDAAVRSPGNSAFWHRLDALLAELSTRFAELPAHRVEQQIEDALCSIREALNLDHCVLAQWVGAGRDLVVTHSAAAPGIDLGLEVAPGLAMRSKKDIPAGAAPVARFAGNPAASEVLEKTAWGGGLDPGSVMKLPLRVGGTPLGVLVVGRGRDRPEAVRGWLSLVGDVLANALARRRAEQALRTRDERHERTSAELRRLKAQLHTESVCLSEALDGHRGPGRLVGKSAALRRALAKVEQVAATPATVLITGETGTGKELFAAAIHELSPRHRFPMVRVNCAAMPAALIESELFGREKGAYTGALAKQVGRFELAHGSTIFLDEVTELPLEAQSKLLRVLQEKESERLGSPRPIGVDVRVVAATNRDLAKVVGEGRFRQDLYYRLNVFPIRVPALRERCEDIPLLVSGFVEEFAKAMGKPLQSIAKSSLQALQSYHWPGNVRELRNLVERSVIVASGPILRIDLPEGAEGQAARSHATLAEVERGHILAVLAMTGWRIQGAQGGGRGAGAQAQHPGESHGEARDPTPRTIAPIFGAGRRRVTPDMHGARRSSISGWRASRNPLVRAPREVAHQTIREVSEPRPLADTPECRFSMTGGDR